MTEIWLMDTVESADSVLADLRDLPAYYSGLQEKAEAIVAVCSQLARLTTEKIADDPTNAIGVLGTVNECVATWREISELLRAIIDILKTVSLDTKQLRSEAACALGAKRTMRIHRETLVKLANR
ncbi:MAG: hypothetical protein FWD57_15710 [Polyangiaceae bacterium]|nr:hypothetical protein [Polyangiaceae bacterium]